MEFELSVKSAFSYENWEFISVKVLRMLHVHVGQKQLPITKLLDGRRLKLREVAEQYGSEKAHCKMGAAAFADNRSEANLNAPFFQQCLDIDK